MSIGGVIVALFVSMQLKVAAANCDGLEIDFPLAKIERTRDALKLTRLRQRKGYKRCEFVTFSAKPLLTLIKRVEASEIGIEETMLTLIMFDGDRGSFVGYGSEVVREGFRQRAFWWIGKLLDEPYFTATFIVDAESRTSAHIETGNSYYRLTPSDRGKGYYLCELDPARLSDNIMIDANAL